jgi:hypothetical protein
MSKNPYFNHQQSEKSLVEDLTIESIKIHGYDMVYIPRTLVGEDTIFGEDAISKFTDGNVIEMYIANVDGFQGEGDFLSKFGLEIRDSIDLIVSKKRFNEALRYKSDIIRPREGDLIYFPLSKGLFEIKFVEHENPFYQLGSLYTYKLSCELFTYSQETLDTGYSDVDVVEDTMNKYAVDLFLGTRYSTEEDFIAGEIIYQVQGSSGPGMTLGDATTYATVMDWSQTGTTGSIRITNIYGPVGSFNKGASASVRGASSNAEYVIAEKVTTTVLVPSGMTGGAVGDNENLEFEVDMNNVFDLSDIDPFSGGSFFTGGS